MYSLKYILLMVLAGSSLLFTACQDDDYAIPAAGSALQNDCIKRTLGPNVVGLDIEFAYAMALPEDQGVLVSATAEATIAGASGTYLEHRSYYTNNSGNDVGIEVGSPSVTSGTKTEVTFTRDTCAATLRYYYLIPEEARGKTVSFTFSARASNGQTVSYQMGPYTIAKMDMKKNIVAIDGEACYFSVADMAVYTAAEAAADPGKIDLVYLYRSVSGITFAHALVSPAADTQYLPGVTLPAGTGNSTPFVKVYALRDRHLADLQYGIYVDDIDLEEIDFTNAPNYGINMKAESGAWVETQDGKYRAYIYVNAVDNANKKITLSMKRLQVK